MPLNLKALALDPDPESVKQARDWVRTVLEKLDREDIVFAAELGVSELVTNAILHGTPPISVRVRGTRTHPRVEVRDASKRPPAVNIEMGRGEELFSTFGRGLGIVALTSHNFGNGLVKYHFRGTLYCFRPGFVHFDLLNGGQRFPHFFPDNFGRHKLDDLLKAGQLNLWRRRLGLIDGRRGG